MKDSRIGAFGAMALVLALGAKLALLAQLGSLGLEVALWAYWARMCSRLWPLSWCAPCPMWGYGHVKSKPLADQITGAPWRPQSCGVFCRQRLCTKR